MAVPDPAQDSSFRQDPHPLPEAQGQAALLLLESLIHSLIDNGTLNREQVEETFASAIEVKEEGADRVIEPAEVHRRSLLLLRQMHLSIAAKVGRYHPE